MSGRKFALNSSYRYGFNGKENDNEVKGEGNQQDYGFRIYDPRLGRFLSTDPLGDEYPWYTPYQFAGNTPIQAIDLDGLEPAYHYFTDDGKMINMPAGDNLQRKVPPEHRQFLPQSSPSGPLMDPFTSTLLDNIPLVGTVKAIVEGVVGYDAAGNKLTPGERLSGVVPYAGKAKRTIKTLKALDKAKDTQKKVKAVHKVDEVVSTEKAIVKKDPTNNRVKLRKNVVEKIKEKQPRNDKGEMIDPNDKQPLDPSKTDLGHKPGEEWRKRKQMHKNKGSSRKEVIEEENNPNLYQLESRSNNRSHKHEKQ